MRPKSSLLFALFPLLLVAFTTCRDGAAAEPVDSVEFFENRIRPVLVNHCYECHASDADDVGGSLVLDSAGGMKVGGDSGPAIAPGDADGSVLISALRYESSEMPPDGKLPDQVIRDFEKWIDAGAVDPRQADGDAAVRHVSSIDLEEGRKFWAFQPIRSVAVPRQSVENSGTDEFATARDEIDAFLHERLRQEGITPVGPASAEVRLRRLCFDLTGLPPSEDLLRRWLADPTDIRWRKTVDQLIASPAFAEHWARHWMDIARYADSNGADFNATHHEAWRYRDYLVRSFANDTPIDQMIRQQIAGDLLPSEDDDQRRDNVVASTFLMLGTKMLSERDKPKLVLDVVDEQIDTVGRAFLGLTLGCARCHDHKFDPVPTEDYYALAGIFRNTVTLKGESQKYVSTWNRVPLPVSEELVSLRASYDAELASMQKALKQAEMKLKAAKEQSSASLAGTVVDDTQATKTGNWKASTYSPDFVGEGYVHDNNGGKGKATIRFAARLPSSGRYEVRLSHTPGPNRSSAVPITLKTAEGDQQVTCDQRTIAIEPMWASLGEFEFTKDSEAVVTIRNEGTSGYVIADAVQFLKVGEDRLEVPKVADVGDPIPAAKKKVDAWKKKIAELKKREPEPMPEGMAPSDLPTEKIADSPIHIRGEVTNLGRVVPRGFLQVCGSGDAAIKSPQGSGRRELADWMTDPNHPLVSRVFVNRVWMHLFGEGIVRTVDNFGMQGERPTHPALLDHLATRFVRDGWHLKPLVRAIVLSAAYQRSSQFDSEAIAIDPENRLLWRMHRRRVPAEAIRDTMLAAAGVLDRNSRIAPMRGRGTLVSSNKSDSKANFDDVSQPCRSLYLPVVRGYVPPLMAKLDAAEPDLLVGKRPTTNVPAQALVLVNSPDVHRWAGLTAERIVSSAEGHEERMQLAYALCLQRRPNRYDHSLASSFFDAADESESELSPTELWREYVAALFASTEFRLLE